MANRFLSFRSFCFIVLLLLMFQVAPVTAQSAAFTYQGKLSDSGNPANGQYDFKFSLWDAASGGTSVADINIILGVTVSNGIFTVTLNFGTSAFPGGNRYLEIDVRPANTGSYTTLTPRQQLLSTPYSIKATVADGLSVTCVNCITSSQIASVNGSAVTGTIPVASVPAGSDSYIQNSTSQQATSNFNISGNGTAGGTLSGNVVNATTQFNLGGQRLLSATGFNNLFAGFNAGTNNIGSSNTFFGSGAGEQNTTGNGNSFFGEFSGKLNTTGASNSLFGSGAGYSNTEGNSNSFFGQQAGNSNTTGSNNAFFGGGAGLQNTTGGNNAFFGDRAGRSNTTGNGNAFFGSIAGRLNTTGSSNAFFGDSAGSTNSTGFQNAFFGTHSGLLNTTGRDNSFFGDGAGFFNTSGSSNAFFGSGSGDNNTIGTDNTFIGNLAKFSTEDPTGNFNTLLGARTLVNSGVFNGTAIGARALVTQSHSLVLGSINGINGCIPANNCDSVNVGIGTTAPVGKLNIVGSAGPVQGIHIDNREIKFRGDGLGHYSIFANRVSSTLTIEDTSSNFNVNTPGNVLLSIMRDGNVGINKSNPNFTLDINGTLSVGILGTGGSEHICRISFNQLALCSSSIRYKTNVATFLNGLGLIRALTPVTFDWKSDGRHDLGLVAEEVERVSPLLVTYNNGEVEGVKYDRIGVVLINAVKEQQMQIEKHQARIESLRAANDALKQEISKQQLQLMQQQQEMGAVKKLLCLSQPRADICKAKWVK